MMKAFITVLRPYDTTKLEKGRGRRNSQSSGEMRRSWEEHLRRKHSTGPFLTLRDESLGSQ